MLKRRLSLVVVVLIAVGIAGFSRAIARGASSPAQILATTGVYVGSCNAEVVGSAVVFGFGNFEDPTCENVVPTQPLPVSASGFLANLVVASEQISQSTPATVTLYVNGVPSQLGCTVSFASPSCTDKAHKIQVNSSETFTVLVACAVDTVCAQGLQATIDRLQPVGQ